MAAGVTAAILNFTAPICFDCGRSTNSAKANGGSVGRAGGLFFRPEHNQGVGGATMIGYREALKDGAEAIVKIDGDGQMPIADLVRVYQKIRDEHYDVVKTVRIKRSDGIYRKIVSNVFNIFFRLLFPYAGSKDINSKPKIFSRENYEKFDLRSNDWFIDAELFYAS